MEGVFIMNINEETRVVKLRNKGLGYRSIANELGLTRDKVRYYCKKSGISGYKYKDKYKVKKEMTDEERELKFVERFNEKFIGFKYYSSFISVDKPFICVCETCGITQERNAQCVRREKELECSNCIKIGAIERTSKERARAKVLSDIKRGIRLVKVRERRERDLVGVCIECCVTFVGNRKGKKYCSEACSMRTMNRTRELRRRTKLKENGSVDLSITLISLIGKDNNTCHICKAVCDKEDYTKTDEGHFITGRMYPSIDHVIPVNKGGTHTWDNVKLAHHYCNTIKRDNDVNEELIQKLTMA